MKVLVTGSSGLIGSALIESLSAKEQNEEADLMHCITISQRMFGNAEIREAGQRI